MKELVNALTQASANRLKSPILGSFILAWIAVNHAFFIEFLFSPSAEKILLVNNHEFDVRTDLLLPVFLSLVYTFGLPFLQGQIDKLRHKYIDGKRMQEHQERRADDFRAQMKANEFQAKSSTDYQTEKLKRDLDHWDTQKEEYKSRIDNLNTQIESSTEQLDSVKNELEVTKAELQTTAETLKDQIIKNSENERQLSEARSIHTNLKATENDLKASREEVKQLKISLDTMDDSYKVLEELALSLYDNMLESDEQIEHNLNEELKNRVGVNSNSIELITRSYRARVMKQRDLIKAYRPMLANLRMRVAEHADQNKSHVSIATANGTSQISLKDYAPHKKARTNDNEPQHKTLRDYTLEHNHHLDELIRSLQNLQLGHSDQLSDQVMSTLNSELSKINDKNDKELQQLKELAENHEIELTNEETVNRITQYLKSLKHELLDLNGRRRWLPEGEILQDFSEPQVKEGSNTDIG
ncbi:hypothetical protein L1D61_26585 [Vibrio mediterranei]|nr:hypothetical protein [Vibrio mediterranei]